MHISSKERDAPRRPGVDRAMRGMTRLGRALVALCAISLLGFATGMLGPLPAAASSRGDGGLPPGTWHQQNSTTSETLFGVSCASVTNCVAVGGDGTTFSPEPGITLHPTAGGQSWTKQTWGTLATLRGVSCVAGTQTCLAVGTDVQGGVEPLLRSTDSGTTWMPRTAPS